MVQQSGCLSGRCKSRYCHELPQEIYYTILHLTQKSAEKVCKTIFFDTFESFLLFDKSRSGLLQLF